ncbi:transposon Tf2-11 polyprotein [Nephila pilipes]|uniref:Transposon Tf2-11 polyprotein n=1 Tax=Nephila pilipes TaxID=299642 RepID=A0A8X6PUX9_NEPPI|nr:transposon Tf2-11 polyprotein [Nephila pilipes]
MMALRGEIAALSKQVERLSRDRSRNRSRRRITSIEIPNPINYDEIAKSQESDLELQNLISNPQGLQLKKIVMPNSDIPLFCDLSTGTVRPYILKEYRQRIFSQLHNMSHPGIRATTKYLISVHDLF